MTESTQFIGWLCLWLLALGFVIWSQRKVTTGVGLVLAYALQLWVTHWLGTSIYALPWYAAPNSILQAGLEQSTYAIVGFAAGAALLGPLLVRSRRSASQTASDVPQSSAWLIRAYLSIGIGAYVAQPFLQGVPTLGALISVTTNLLLVAFALECWTHLQGRRRSVWRWIALSTLLPFVTIVTQGFLSYGFAAMLTIFAFVASVFRPRWTVVAFGVVASFLALSLYVTYMRDRPELRAAIWGQESYTVRLGQMVRTFSDFEFLDLTNEDHLERIDNRLNQNSLVGAAVGNLETRPELFAHGETVWDAVLSPIPRAIWPNKPIAAGSGNLVSRFTGIRFAEGTSVGIGHVMEWYVNFGWQGVLLGSVLFGVLLSVLDAVAIHHLRNGDLPRFALWYLPSISLLQVGGSLVEAVSGACAGLAIGYVIHRLRPARFRQVQPSRWGRQPFVPASAGGLRRSRW